MSTETVLADILPHLVNDAGQWHARYREIEIRSVFQPVISITHERVVGYEALLRASDRGVPVPPWNLFERAAADGDEVWLDRLAMAVHASNFALQQPAPAWLFLNVRPHSFGSGKHVGGLPFAEELARHLNLRPNSIVLEVLENASQDESALAAAVEDFRGRHFMIAIDDFGTGFSNFDRIWQTAPDIVKLDRSLVARLSQGNSAYRTIRHLVIMLHQAGCMVLAEGVETDTELVVLMDADVDFIQGFWLGHPNPLVSAAGDFALQRCANMWPLFDAYRSNSAGSARTSFEALEHAVLAGAHLYQAWGDLEQAAAAVFALAGARRVFVTDELGVQRHASIATPSTSTAAPASAPPTAPPTELPSNRATNPAGRDPQRLDPLLPDVGSNWSRRAYFKRAMASLGRVAVMGPHFSLTEGRDCFTAAVALERDGRVAVFCCDFVQTVKPAP